MGSMVDFVVRFICGTASCEIIFTCEWNPSFGGLGKSTFGSFMRTESRGSLNLTRSCLDEMWKCRILWKTIVDCRSSIVSVLNPCCAFTHKRTFQVFLKHMWQLPEQSEGSMFLPCVI
ncbi:hypothetical protein O6H91_16G004800 [Diphasiastrum complanatum]|uniref:Uncharacterized protein n=2 Tax=Diphasiastrum complanatum TaxID=34168 RepID=A0ACC2B9I6_DIPCM|nr:hypothetical protein O6H91_16G004700 [Diphasiastrum complanatum]KAJ7526390.1 hypothetical protein O6H91_16G004800 [Diphasiastrum complanatum]